MIFTLDLCHLYDESCEQYSGKIFLITMSQFVMGWHAKPGESIPDVTILVTQGDTGTHRGEHRHHHELPREVGPHTTTLHCTAGPSQPNYQYFIDEVGSPIINSSDQTSNFFHKNDPITSYRLVLYETI